MAPPEHGFRDALQAGNHQRAGAWLVQSFASEVFGLCFAYVQDGATAEDLSQEVFAKAFAGLEGYRGEASARTWLLKIARNRCVDHLRAHKRWSGTESDQDPDEQAEEVSLPSSILARRAEVESALAALDEGERALIVLRFRNGLSYQELAAAFGIKVGTARMRVSRALGKMRSILDVPSVEMPVPAPARARAASAKSLERAPLEEMDQLADLEEEADELSSVLDEAPPLAAAAPSAAPPPASQAPAPAPMAASGAPPTPTAPRKRRTLSSLFRRKQAAPAPGPAPAQQPGAAPEHALQQFFSLSPEPLASSLQQGLEAMVRKLPSSS